MKSKQYKNNLAVRALGLPARITVWLLIALQALFPCVPAALAVSTNSQQPRPAQTPSRKVAEITPNHDLPAMQTVSSSADFSEFPTDAEIGCVRIFSEPLLPCGSTTPEENHDLAQALIGYLNSSNNANFQPLEEFLTAHPHTAWRATLLNGMAAAWRHDGHFSLALSSYREAWECTKTNCETKSRDAADEALGGLLNLDTALGRTDESRSLLAQVKGRIMNSSISEQLTEAYELLWQVIHHPQEVSRCGPTALKCVCAISGKNISTKSLDSELVNDPRGMSLFDLCALANRMGLNYKMARRDPNAAMILPAVIHWKVGHYGAVVKEQAGRFLVVDPCLGANTWIDKATLDAEGSGYYLVPNGNLSHGWQPVDTEEAKEIFGKGPGSQNDPAHTKPNDIKRPLCHSKTPMAQYSFHAMLVSLNIVDTPVGYTPPRGPDAHFQVTYNQREANQPAVFSYSNFGQKWTFNWLSYITDTPGQPEEGGSLYVQGGGTEIYGYGVPDPDDFGVILENPAGGYMRTLPDGSIQIFSLPDGSTTYPRKTFLTALIDPTGNSLTFTYDTNSASGYNVIRLRAATDSIGQVTSIYYDLPDDPSKITKVTDPFGRSATFDYNPSGQLIRITDILGIQSQFTYNPFTGGTSDFITSLTTPYGKTLFEKGDGTDDINPDGYRWIQATDPLGQTERMEYDDTVDSSQIPDYGSLPPAGMGIGAGTNYIIYRNSFYWDKNAMQYYTAGDYSNAEIFHWLHTDPRSAAVSGTPECTKLPLEGRVWYLYQDQIDTFFLGTNNQPTVVGRLLDDGSTQLYQYSYNGLGKVTQSIDPLNRISVFTYSTNLIDLTEVQQVVGTNLQTLAMVPQYTNHLPLITIDAAGNTNYFSYDSYGQLVAITNPLSQVMSLAYDHNGYLTNIVNALPAASSSISYDSVGRVKTVTDSLGYVISMAYDAADRSTNIAYPDNTYEQTVYNNLDPVLQRDRMGRWSQHTYDALRRPTDTYDSLGRHTHLEWCGCGSLASVTDPLNQTTSWIRDVQGRVTAKKFADNSQINYAYETNTSRLKAVTDANNQTTLYGYFADNDVSSVSYSNAIVITPGVSFLYDTNFNRVTSMVDGLGTNVYSYFVYSKGLSGAGLLASVSNSFTRCVTSYAYDALNRATNRVIDGIAESVCYDSVGRVSIVTDALGSFTNEYLGGSTLISSNFLPNGQITAYAYSNVTNSQRLAEILNQNTSGGTISKFDYQYDADGDVTNLIQQTDGNTPVVNVMRYDPVHQLLALTVFSNTVAAPLLRQYSFAYDSAGNRTSEQMDSAVSESSYNNMNELNARTNGSGNVLFSGSVSKPSLITVNGTMASTDYRDTNFYAYTSMTNGTNQIAIIATDYNGNAVTNKYQFMATNCGSSVIFGFDSNGNETNYMSTMITNIYKYDAENRLVEIVGGDNESHFAYDGMGRRVQDVEKTNGIAIATNLYVWCGATLCEERNLDGSVVTKRFFGEGEQISGTNYYFTRDRLGSIREILDYTGTIQARFDYSAYGRQSREFGTLSPDFGYAGMYCHGVSRLNLTLYRAYDSDLGRWLNRDPDEERAGLNLYEYGDDNPENEIDPNGRNTVVLFLLGAAIVGISIYELEENWGQGYDNLKKQHVDDPESGPTINSTNISMVADGARTITVDTIKQMAPPEVPKSVTQFITDQGKDAVKDEIVDDMRNPGTINRHYHKTINWLDDKFHQQTKYTWECVDRTGDYLETSPISPGPNWRLVRTFTQ